MISGLNAKVLLPRNIQFRLLTVLDGFWNCKDLQNVTEVWNFFSYCLARLTGEFTLVSTITE